MLGLFKGKSKDKLVIIDDRDNKCSVTKEERKLSLKRSKTQEKTDKGNENKGKGKEEKFSRFSFKRNKSSDRKRSAKDNSDGSSTSESSIPSLSNGKDVLIDPPSRKVSNDDTDRDESESQTSSTFSSSEANSEKALGDSTSSSTSLPTQNSNVSYLSGSKSENNVSNSSNIISEKFLQNSKTYPRKVPVYEQPYKLKTIAPVVHSSSYRTITPVVHSSSYSSSTSSPSFARKAYFQTPVGETSYKIVATPTTPEGTLSMLSTPSSSTSSLCSISGRPISPSGRRTPPGPKLGTGGRIPSSPTTIRKASRTNIKTNPTVSGRRAGSISPLNNIANIPSFVGEVFTPSSPSVKRNDDSTSAFEFKNPEFSLQNKYHQPIATLSQTFDPNYDISDNPQTPPLSPSPSPARTRHSVSSMQSLESIPEIENDPSNERYGGGTSSATRRSIKKLTSKPSNSLADQQEENLPVEESKNKTLLNNPQNVNDHLHLLENSKEKNNVMKTTLKPKNEIFSSQNKNFNRGISERNHIMITRNLNNVQQFPFNESKDEFTVDNQNNKSIVSKKPPVVSKRVKENGKLPLIVIEDKGKSNKSTLEDNLSPDEGAVFASLSLGNSETMFVKCKEDVSKQNQKLGNTEEGPSTHFIFRIPLSSPEESKTILRRKRASSLELISSNKDKRQYKEDVFPKSSSTGQSWPRLKRSKSPTRVASMPEGIDVKFEIPITIEELKKQAEDLATTIKIETKRKRSIVTDCSTTKNYRETAEGNDIKQTSIMFAAINDSNHTEADISESSGSKLTILNSKPSSNPSTANTDEPNYVPTRPVRRSRSSAKEQQLNAQNITEIVEESQDQNTKNIKEQAGLETDQDLESESLNDNSQNLISTSSLSEPSETETTTEINDLQTIVQEILTIQIEDKTNNLQSKLNIEDELIELQSKNVDIYMQTEARQETEWNWRTEIEKCKKELSAQELKYQHQIDQLAMKLSEKQSEVADLVEELKEVSEKRNFCSENLEARIEELKIELRDKEAAVERMKLELQYAKNETDLSKTKMRRLEDELGKTREVTSSLQEQNSNRAKDTIRLKDMESKLKSAEEELRKSESVRKDLQQNLADIEAERDEEMKIVQDALDEAAQEREELIATFEKELQLLNKTNTAREQQMMEDFEWKLREMEKEHKKKLEEKQKQGENTLQRVKRHSDDEEVRQKLEKMKNELNAEWEDKLRTECSRLKAELDELHSEEKHLAVESMKVQKEQDIQALKKSWELRNEEMAKKISTLKDNLTEKDAYYHKEQDTQRTNADRDIWDLRMKLQKMNEACFDQKQLMEEKHRDEMERCKVDYEDRIGELERRLATFDAQSGVDLVANMEKEHWKQMQHIEEQHRLSMERLREENESEGFQAVEEARVIITKHHEYIEASLREQLAESVANNSKTTEEIESFRQSLARRDETIRSLKEEINRYQSTKNDYTKNNYSPPRSYIPPNQTANIQAGLSCSQYSLASSNDSFGSGNSQGRYSLPETTGVYVDAQEDNEKASASGLLGKVFGSGWFSTPKSKETVRKGSTPLANKKAY